jgi:hypothetical protein
MQGDLNLQRQSRGRLRLGALILVAWAALALTPLAAWAGEVVCTLTPGTATHYIAPQVSIGFDEYGKARIADSIIESTGRDAVFGEVSANNSKMLRFIWELSHVKPNPHEARSRDANLLVRLTIMRADGSAQLTAVDKSYREYSYRAVGKCAISD